MNDSDIREALTHIEQIERAFPTAGGMIKSVGVFERQWTCLGDKVGLCRLGVAVLRYALTSQIPAGRPLAEAVSLDDFFSPDSPVTGLFIQLQHMVIWRHTRLQRAKLGWSLGCLAIFGRREIRIRASRAEMGSGIFLTPFSRRTDCGYVALVPIRTVRKTAPSRRRTWVNPASHKSSRSLPVEMA
jgi:hypothetical protein